MNATSPLGKFLAAIAGKLDKSKLPMPSNEAEYYLNEIAQKDSGSGGVFFVPFTFGHMDEAFTLLTTSVSIDEIISAADSKFVVAVYVADINSPNEKIYLPLAKAKISVSVGTKVTFCSFSPNTLSKTTIEYHPRTESWRFFDAPIAAG